MADTLVSISIVATVRNENKTIAEFLDSLLQQSHRPNEIMIVDGASTDGTREILQEYAKRGEINLISQDCNIAEGRNLGIAAVKTTHIGVTDAGCKVDKDWLREIAGCFANNPGTDVVAANFRFETHSRFEEAVIHATFRSRRDRTDLSPYHPSSRSVAFTKDAWVRAGGYPEWLYAAEDTLFNIRLRQIGCKFVFCPHAFVQWRPRENWKSLAKQRINFSRGNARTGFGIYGYTKSLRMHGLFAVLLALGVWQPISLLALLAVVAWYVRSSLWPQAVANVPGRDYGMRLRVLLLMEFVRLVQIYGFLRGRWDRRFDKKYVENQRQYMGVTTVDELSFLKNG